MTNNSKAMTIEDHLVQRLKSDTLYQTIGDDDAMTLLVQKALHQALFKDRSETDGYRTTNKPSVVMEAAQDAAAKGCKSLADKVLAEIMADPATAAAIQKAIVQMLPSALLTGIDYMLSNQLKNEAQVATNSLRRDIATKLNVTL